MLAGAEGLPLLRSSRPLAGLTQARFDHRLFESPPDSLINADALPGSSPFFILMIKLKTVHRTVFNFMVRCKGLEPLTTWL